VQIQPAKATGFKGSTAGLTTGQFNWAALATTLGLFVTFVLGLAVIQFASPNLVGNDGYFHIKFAQVMHQQGLIPDFIWLPVTILNRQDFYDHHFLFHVLMIPFTFGDLRLGAKWMSIIFPALAFLAGYGLLRSQRVPYAALWSLGFLGLSEPFLYRMSMPRVQSVSLLMLFLMLHVLLLRQYRWLLPLSFVFIWLYDAFPLVLLLMGVYVAVRWLLDKKLEMAPLLYTLAGLLLGVLVNPYFPNNIRFMYHHILPKLFETTAISVGGEWYPYRTWSLVENSGLALLAFVAGAFALGLSERRIETRTAVLMGLAVGFGLMLFKSRRFVEYYPPFALLFCALAWTPLFEQWRKQRSWMDIFLAVALLLILGGGIWYNGQAVRQQVQESSPYDRFAGAAGWLQKNTPPGTLVFQTDWDDFTWLYFYNTHNRYTAGLDPTYMQTYNAGLYEEWRAITRGWVKNPARLIATKFKSGYVVTDLGHNEFLAVAQADPDLQQVYRDQYAAVFLVLTEPDKWHRDY